MKTTKQNYTRYLMPENMTKKHFLDSLKKYFVVEEVESKTETFSILENFVWGLHEQRLMAIQHENNNISLWNEDDVLDPDLSLTIENSNSKAKFWWDFPDSPTRDILRNILNLRALHPVYQGIIKIEQFQLLNNDGKVLVFCQLISICDPDKPGKSLIHQAKVIPVTGYNNENKQAIEILKYLGGFEPKLSPLDTLLSAIGVVPQPFSIKPDILLPADISARAAASFIISTMISKLRLTESGIIKDIDSEYLHHYRVGLRMIRAAVVQLKEVFPADDVASLKERFGSLARQTNYLRDLDVFVLDKDRYMNLLPESLRNGLLPMFSDFENNRVKEVERISAWLSGKTYQKEISELESLFENGYSTIETQYSEQPTIELAVAKIQKRYKKIQYASAQITHSTPDEDIHSLRIDCKKLRYLLYFFDNLFNKKQAKVAGNHLKSLQNKLGVFNDLTVQKLFLENYLYKIEHKPEKDILLIASLGGLISSLHTMQIQEREKCITELAIFSNAENRQLFKTTFKSNHI